MSAMSSVPERHGSGGGGWDEAVAKKLESGFYNHSFCPVGPEGPAFCIWEVREGIAAEEF